MTRRSKINPDFLPRLVAAGLTSREIANLFGVNPPAVVTACHKIGLSLPGRRRGAGEGKAPLPDVSAQGEAEGPPAPAYEAPDGNPIRSSLVATGGRGADLSEWAAANGKTITQARLAWFRLGLPLVPKKGV